jgi:hypothetical protein
MLNEEGYSYAIISPINLQILLLEGHRSQLPGGKKSKHFYLSGSNFIAKGIQKSC